MSKLKWILVFMLCLAIAPMAWAEEPTTKVGDPGVVRTATMTDLDGKPVQFQDCAFTDTWRQNRFQGRIVKVVSALRYPDQKWNAKTNPYEPTAVTLATFNNIGNGLGRDATVGFVSNLPNAGGLIGLGLTLRPSNTTQSNNGGNASQSQGATAQQFQGQGQGQAQGQAQGQIQGQLQGQGQSTGPFSPVAVIP